MDKIKLKPLGARVLVKHIDIGEQTKGGIIIPDVAKDKPQEGTVVAIGTKPEGFQVKVGDRVIVNKYGGTEVSLDGDTLTLVKEDDLIGLLG